MLNPPATAFDLQPVLKGELVRLRPLRPDDFEALFAVAADPLIWEQHPEPTRYQRPVFETFFRNALTSRGALCVEDAVSGAIIGSSRFYELNAEQTQVTIGYTFLARSHWGKGHNREMKKLMLGHAFAVVETVLFEIGETNHRSRRAIEGIGARLIGAGKAGRVVYRISRDR